VLLLALLVPQFFPPDDDDGGPDRGGSGTTSQLDVAGVQDFDPLPGDGSEHSEEINLSIDGKPSTAWSTENYSSPLGVLKPGVGLVFDLGPDAEIGRISISGEAGTVEIRAGDDAPTEAEDLEVIEETSVSGTEEVTLDEASDSRYWLLWITALPNETGTASISEVIFSIP
jgi:hypothetical protein